MSYVNTKLTIKLGQNFLSALSFVQVLSLIFNQLNFHGHLRLSRVCRRFLRVIGNDAKFMRSVHFWASPSTIHTLSHKLMRTYKTVSLSDYDSFEELSDLELALIENVETLRFQNCSFRDTSEFVSVLKHCKQLKTVVVGNQLFVDLETEPMEKIQTPVSLAIESPYCKSWTCFGNISKISVRNWTLSDMENNLRLLSQHARVITTIFASHDDFDAFSEQSFKTPELQLTEAHLLIDDENNAHAARFLAHHRTSLMQLSVQGSIQQQMMDAIFSNLVGLEILDLFFDDESIVRLSDLKNLPKLKKLTASFRNYNIDFEQDIGELLSLEQFKLKFTNELGKFKLATRRPNVTLKMLELGFLVDRQLLGQIAEVCPNLIHLKLSSCVSLLLYKFKPCLYCKILFSLSFQYYPEDLTAGFGVELNKLINLRSFAIFVCTINGLIDDEFMGALQLPNLTKLNFNQVTHCLMF
jgi:hypothetical protein